MDGASGGGKTIGDPEGLLRSALEKIVFFECRVSQLESELAAARGVAERAREDAAKAHRRGVELDQAAAGERGARADADRRTTELEERVRLLETERERLLTGLVDRARVSGATNASGEPAPEEGGADLAGFIAELRAEIEALRAFKAAAEGAGFRGDGGAPSPIARRGPSASSVTDVAAGFEHAGRVGLTTRDAARMKDLLATRADRALYERSMDDLAAPDGGRRLRAVRALEALGSKASAPLLAAALGREPDAQVKAALLSALARFKEPFTADLAAREMSDARPAVRIAALGALAAVAAGGVEERLAAAMGDASPLVRRRAALLLGFAPGERAEKALAVALADPDRGVARAAAAALSGRPNAHAQGALARGLEHPDGSVRRAAASALSRLAGERVDGDGPAPARRAASRRIAERLAGMNGEEIRAAVLRGADAVATHAADVVATHAADVHLTSHIAPGTAAATLTPGTAAATLTPGTAAATSISPRAARAEEAIASPLPSVSGGEGKGAPVIVTLYPRAVRNEQLTSTLSPRVARREGAIASPLPRASGGEGKGEGARVTITLYPRAVRREPLTPTLSPRATRGEGGRTSVAARGEGAMTSVAARRQGAIASPLPRVSGGEGKGEGAASPAPRTAIATISSLPGADLAPGIIAELRAALRGCTAEALATALGAPQASVDAALHTLAAAGQVALRGTRWFTS